VCSLYCRHHLLGLFCFGLVLPEGNSAIASVLHIFEKGIHLDTSFLGSQESLLCSDYY